MLFMLPMLLGIKLIGTSGIYIAKITMKTLTREVPLCSKTTISEYACNIEFLMIRKKKVEFLTTVHTIAKSF
jgi:hypothetical protein